MPLVIRPTSEGSHLEPATNVPVRRGLSSADARHRLEKLGSNAIADVSQHPVRRALGKLWAPVPWMLEAAILLQLFLGDYVEAGVVALLLVANAAIGFFQEGAAQATLDALKSKLALIAAVQRDGSWTTIPAATLVVGDLVRLSLGSIVVADVRVLDGSILVDQSMLTGESLPVEAGGGAEAYAGALVRRGEAVGEVIATGIRTRFGRTAELVQSAKVESSEQKAILRVVRNLALFNGAVTILLTIYALWLPMPRGDIIPLVLVAVLSSIPVALPSMFTLAAAVGARALARNGVLPTSLSAVDEAGGIDILCSDKTGTLTRNELAVMSVHALPQFDDRHVLALASLASSDGGQDPVDAAIRTAAARQPATDKLELVRFIPFDPVVKRSEATAREANGVVVRVVKGAFAVVQGLSTPSPACSTVVDELQAKGYRVLAVASGAAAKLQMAGLIALSDPPREDSAALITELTSLGVRTIMVTGDAPATAKVVAEIIGLSGPVCGTSPLPEDIQAEHFSIFAGVLPEDKYQLVKALQKAGHIVGMCGDGANDAPALRQAQMGIAVSTATDVAKSAAGIVLTEPGLGGIVASVKEGRTTFQRILTYALRSIVHKVVQVLFLASGLMMTGQAILTPMLMVLMMVTGDFLAMSSSTDNVRPSPTPSVWKIGSLTAAGIIMGIFDLLFCLACFSTGRFLLNLDTGTLQTLTVVTLVFSGQAVFYVARERQHLWNSLPGKWLIICSAVDLTLISLLAVNGVLMRPLAIAIVAGLLAAAVIFSLLLDLLKVALFRRLRIA
jgi:H+-transporting ATPase